MVEDRTVYPKTEIIYTSYIMITSRTRVKKRKMTKKSIGFKAKDLEIDFPKISKKEKKKAKNYQVIALVVLWLLILMAIAFFWPSCQEPMKRVGIRCCIDSDNNNICDSEEVPAAATVPPEPSVQPDANIVQEAQVTAYVNATNETEEEPEEEEQPVQEQPTPISDYIVTIAVFKFEPEEITVPVGATITWVNKDTRPHSVSSHYQYFLSPRMSPGDSWAFQFNSIGEFTYVDPVFPQMEGKVIVKG
ncbi:hypothetical protein GF351_02895 [Candidatus Woesearchaeota archaeon]|nr:hypothetical protein [Candidatus Woesearchaeota archaeon]